VDSELVRKLASRGTGLIAGYQLFDLGWAEPSMNLLSGTGAYFWGPSWDHFYEVTKTFSLLEGVRVTSDELHSVVRITTSSLVRGGISLAFANQDNGDVRTLNRAEFLGGSILWKGWTHASTEEVPS
jgi:hypothetical protein